MDDLVNKYNSSYHSVIRIKPVDVKSNTYVDSSKKDNDKDPKFKINDIARISKYKNIFAKGYAPNWSEKVFVITKFKNTVPWTYVINNLRGKEIAGMFTKKNCKRQFKVV